MTVERATFDERVRREVSFPIKRQVARSSLWFIRLRWGAVVGIALAGSAFRFLGYPFDWRWMIGVAVVLSLVNVVFHFLSPRFMLADIKGSRLRAFNLMQIIADWLAVAVLVHATGGVSSPCIFFFFFHLVIAAILLPVRMVYGLAGAAILLVSTVFYIGSHATAPLVSMTLAGFGISAFVLVLVTSWVSNLIRQRMRQLSEAKVRLEDATGQLEAILKVIRVIGEDSAMDDLLARVLEQAAGLWEIRAGFVLFKPPKEENAFFAATHGLDTAAPEASWLMELESVRKALESRDSLIVDDIHNLPEFGNCPSLQWLNKVDKRSLLLVPLQVSDGMIGAIGLVSQYPGRFNETDADYFRLFGDLVAIDIQNLQIQRTLREHEQTRTWFYRRAAHDLRAPLSAARTMLTAIVENYAEDPLQLHALMGKADRRLEELQELVDELLLLAENRVERLEVDSEPVDLAVVMEEVVETYRPQAEERSIKLIAPRLTDEMPVRATLGGLRRILSNLISNAIKYNRDGGEVEVNLSIEESRLMLVVADTGIGIPDEAAPRIFQEFYRAPNAKSHTNRGTGLGLAIVKQLVESYGGRVQVEKGRKTGTSFIVSFPHPTKI